MRTPEPEPMRLPEAIAERLPILDAANQSRVKLILPEQQKTALREMTNDGLTPNNIVALRERFSSPMQLTQHLIHSGRSEDLARYTIALFRPEELA